MPRPLGTAIKGASLPIARKHAATASISIAPAGGGGGGGIDDDDDLTPSGGATAAVLTEAALVRVRERYAGIAPASVSAAALHVSGLGRADPCQCSALPLPRASCLLPVAACSARRPSLTRCPSSQTPPAASTSTQSSTRSSTRRHRCVKSGSGARECFVASPPHSSPPAADAAPRRPDAFDHHCRACKGLTWGSDTQSLQYNPQGSPAQHRPRLDVRRHGAAAHAAAAEGLHAAAADVCAEDAGAPTRQPLTQPHPSYPLAALT
jgi:hypothetical protein